MGGVNHVRGSGILNSTSPRRKYRNRSRLAPCEKRPHSRTMRDFIFRETSATHRTGTTLLGRFHDS